MVLQNSCIRQPESKSRLNMNLLWQKTFIVARVHLTKHIYLGALRSHCYEKKFGHIVHFSHSYTNSVNPKAYLYKIFKDIIV
jgi:hypothetical protein